MADRSNFQWTIEVRGLPESELLSSPIFSFAGCEYAKWCLQYRKVTHNQSMIYLCLVSYHTFDIKCAINWSLEYKHLSESQEATFTKPWEKLSYGPFDAQRYIPRSMQTLTIDVTMRLIEDVKTSSKSNKEDTKHPLVNLSEDLGGLLERGLYGDLTLSVGGKQLKVHKLIMVARSPLMAAMLGEGLASDQVHIPDVDYDVMQIVVRYIYTGQVDDIETNVNHLYPVACTYALTGLKALCEESIEKCLNSENAAQTLVLVHELSQDLKTRVIDFMKNNFKDVTASAEFKRLLPEHLSLFMEVFCAIHDVDLVLGAHAAA